MRGFDRRALIAGLGLAAWPVLTRARSFPDPGGRLAAIEAGIGGRLGVAAARLDGSRAIGWRADERFKMCSTFKLLLVGLVLERIDRGRESLAREIHYSKADLMDYAPAAKAHLAEGGMTVAALCEAAITLSDNTAANLLLASVGGPPAVTAFVRRLGDPVTRLDHDEPELNRGADGDPRDTTTPAAMTADVKRLAFGDALSPACRARLRAWLLETRTGDHRLKAGMPGSARVGDKTGTWDPGGRHNDVAIVWPAGGSVFLVSAYTSGSRAAPARIDAALAEVGRVVFDALA
jgi:beta-lactamase class A